MPAFCFSHVVKGPATSLRRYCGAMKRRVNFLTIGVLALAITACSSPPPPAEDPVQRLDGLRAAIDDGADCPDLFALLDQMDEESSEYPSAQGELRNVGCFMRDSERSDTALQSQAAGSPWLGVPGQEVVPATGCLDAAGAAALESDSTLAEPLIAATLDACQTVDEWMSALALEPGMLGMTPGYIPQLLDLQSVCYSYIESAVCQDAIARGIEVGP